MRKTRDEIKIRGSVVNEITSRGDFVKELRDSIRFDQDTKYKLEVISLKNSKIADPIIVELKITEF